MDGGGWREASRLDIASSETALAALRQGNERFANIVRRGLHQQVPTAGRKPIAFRPEFTARGLTVKLETCKLASRDQSL